MPADRWNDVETLFHTVMEQKPEDRLAHLHRVCADEQIRGEVESLLRYEQDGERLLESRPWSPNAPGVGTQVDSYRLEAVLGEGGMGIVYRATDIKLNRLVALKFLSDDFADNDARQHFQHEARMISSLNHPHILTVHDAGEFNGQQYLVTELVDGGTLKDWRVAEERTWLQIVELLVDVADGLTSAHDAGILHRDIKPANILVTSNGYAKLADFGIAKRSEIGVSDPADAVAGTLTYMSPEQASGKPVDARSDIYSFGLVLYEMLTGRKAFESADRKELLEKVRVAAIEPLPAHMSAALRRVVEKTLQKEPEGRYQTARELVQDLRRLMHGQLAARPAPYWKLAVAAGVLLAAILFAVRSRQLVVPSQLQYTQITNFSDSARAPALSPDGKRVAFIRGGEYFQSRGQIFVKELPEGKAVQLTNDPNLKYAPVFTPDGSRIAYTLLKPGGSWDTWTVPVSGGMPELLLANASGLTWMTSGKVLYSEIMSGTGTHMGIVSSTESHSDVRRIYFPDHQRAMAHYSYASPDRNWVLIVEMDKGTAWQRCRLISLASLESRQVGPEGACIAAAWSPDGKWMYFNAEVGGILHLWRQRFPQGTPEQLTFGPSEEEGIAISLDGRALITSLGVRRSTVWLHDRSGERALAIEGLAFEPRLSSDGKRVFYLFRQNPGLLSSQTPAGGRSSPFYQTGELWAMDVATGTSERILTDFAVTRYDLSADGKTVVFSGGKNENSGIWLAPVDRHEPPHRVTRGGMPAFANDGKLIFIASEGERSFLYESNTDGSGRRRIADTFVLGKAGTSYDRRWATALVPAVGKDTNWQTVAFQIQGSGVRKLCAFLCGVAWSPDGKYLYLNSDISRNSPGGRTFVIPIPSGETFPEIPAEGFDSPNDALKLPGVKVIGQNVYFAGPEPSTYVYNRKEFQSNLFRITLPQ